MQSNWWRTSAPGAASVVIRSSSDRKWSFTAARVAIGTTSTLSPLLRLAKNRCLYADKAEGRCSSIALASAVPAVCPDRAEWFGASVDVGGLRHNVGMDPIRINVVYTPNPQELLKDEPETVALLSRGLTVWEQAVLDESNNLEAEGNRVSFAPERLDAVVRLIESLSTLAEEKRSEMELQANELRDEAVKMAADAGVRLDVKVMPEGGVSVYFPT